MAKSNNWLGYAAKEAAYRQSLGPCKEWKITRDGDRDLVVKGWRLGEGRVDRATLWEAHVAIYLTQKGKLVGTSERRRYSHADTMIESRAAVCENALELLRWLKKDNGKGKLGPASKDAWEAAARAYPPLQASEVEVVE